MAQAPSIEQQVQNVIGRYNDLIAAKDANGLLDLYWDWLDYPPVDRATMKKVIEDRLKNQTFAARLELLAVETRGQSVCAKVRLVGSTDETPSGTYLFMMRPYEESLRICGTYKQLDPNAFDPKTKIYTSRKGKLSLQIPDGWSCCDTSSFLGGLILDSVLILAPDLRSSVTFGFVQLPVRLGSNDLSTAQKCIEADIAMERRSVKDHEPLDHGPTAVAGREGYRQVSQFRMPSSTEVHRRMRVYVCEYPMLYFFICDAVPADTFDALLPQFHAIISSLDLAAAGNLTRQEAIAAEQAKGSIAGQVYTSDEFNCFIAAPAGWEISTSPNPAHLAEMRYQKGNSLVRLIAAKGLNEGDSLEDVFHQEA